MINFNKDLLGKHPYKFIVFYPMTAVGRASLKGIDRAEALLYRIGWM